MLIYASTMQIVDLNEKEQNEKKRKKFCIVFVDRYIIHVVRYLNFANV